MARPKRVPEKLLVGLTPEMKRFLEEKAREEGCDMGVIVRRAISEYMKKSKNQDQNN